MRWQITAVAACGLMLLIVGGVLKSAETLRADYWAGVLTSSGGGLWGLCLYRWMTIDDNERKDGSDE